MKIFCFWKKKTLTREWLILLLMWIGWWCYFNNDWHLTEWYNTWFVSLHSKAIFFNIWTGILIVCFQYIVTFYSITTAAIIIVIITVCICAIDDTIIHLRYIGLLKTIFSTKTSRTIFLVTTGWNSMCTMTYWTITTAAIFCLIDWFRACT